jgi:hypothetical protein
MSRKNRILEADATSNISPKIWFANRGYSEYKPDLKTGKIRDAVVVLYHKSYCKDKEGDSDQHPLVLLGGILGKLLQETEQLNMKNLIFVDISNLIPDGKYEEWMDEEGSSINLEKLISKPVCRVLEKMFLYKATVVAFDSCCQLLLKIIPTSTSSVDKGHKLTEENISKMIFINPILSSRCLNVQFRGTPSAFALNVRADVTFFSENERDTLLPVLRSFFPKGDSSIRSIPNFGDILFSILSVVKDPNSLGLGVIKKKDLEAANLMGETVWLSELSITMNKNSKQYEQSIDNITTEIVENFIIEHKKRQRMVKPDVRNGKKYYGSSLSLLHFLSIFCSNPLFITCSLSLSFSLSFFLSFFLALSKFLS